MGNAEIKFKIFANVTCGIFFFGSPAAAAAALNCFVYQHLSRTPFSVVILEILETPKMELQFVLVFVLTFATSVLFASPCPDYVKEDFRNGLKPPRTLISSAPEHIKFYNGNYSVVIDGIGIEIRFDCWAPYPIDVQFKGHLVRSPPPLSPHP